MGLKCCRVGCKTKETSIHIALLLPARGIDCRYCKISLLPKAIKDQCKARPNPTSISFLAQFDLLTIGSIKNCFSKA